MSSEQRTSSFRVMTYNIRMDTVKDGKNQWNFRKDRVISLIHRHTPDLLGVQEALPHQMIDLQNGLSAFGSYGVGRDDGKDRGEFSAIFYRLDRFELNDKGTFWLSETPDTPGSKGWDAALPRICSWVKLKDRSTNNEIYYFNTHFDHQGETARRESARLILTEIQKIAGSTMPIVLTGDFNTGPTSDAYRTIITNTAFQDAKLVTETPHSGPDGTWSSFDVAHGIGDQIDYIFPTSSHFKVLHHAHLTDSENMLYPSDHLPVLAEIAYKS
jgi:endonuclease/exonuclease/phosphatase family metal-dependent hydrolase